MSTSLDYVLRESTNRLPLDIVIESYNRSKMSTFLLQEEDDSLKLKQAYKKMLGNMKGLILSLQDKYPAYEYDQSSVEGEEKKDVSESYLFEEDYESIFEAEGADANPEVPTADELASSGPAQEKAKEMVSAADKAPSAEFKKLAASSPDKFSTPEETAKFVNGMTKADKKTLAKALGGLFASGAGQIGASGLTSGLGSIIAAGAGLTGKAAVTAASGLVSGGPVGAALGLAAYFAYKKYAGRYDIEDEEEKKSDDASDDESIKDAGGKKLKQSGEKNIFENTLSILKKAYPILAEELANPSSEQAQELFLLAELFFSAYTKLIDGISDYLESLDINRTNEPINKITKGKISNVVNKVFIPSKFTTEKLKKAYEKIQTAKQKISDMKESDGKLEELDLKTIGSTISKGIKKIGSGISDAFSKLLTPVTDGTGTSDRLKKLFLGKDISKALKRDLIEMTAMDFASYVKKNQDLIIKLRESSEAKLAGNSASTATGDSDTSSREDSDKKSRPKDKNLDGDRKSTDAAPIARAERGKGDKELDAKKIDLDSLDDFTDEQKKQLTRILFDKINSSNDEQIKQVFKVDRKSMSESIAQKQISESIDLRSFSFLLEDSKTVDQKVYDLFKTSINDIKQDVPKEKIRVLVAKSLNKNANELKINDEEAASEESKDNSVRSERISLSSLYANLNDDEKKEINPKDVPDIAEIFNEKNLENSIEINPSFEEFAGSSLSRELLKSLKILIKDKVVESTEKNDGLIIERWNYLAGVED